MSRRARRLLRRLRRLVAGSRVGFVYHAAYRRAVFGAPMDALRGERILTFLEDGGWIRRRAVFAPRAAALGHLVRVHGAGDLRESDRPESASQMLGGPVRGERILTFLEDGGWIRRRDVFEPRPAALEHLVRVHGAEYLRELDRPETVSKILGVPLRAEEARLAVECQRLIAGGTILATRLALRHGVTAVHLGGGLHHAGPGRGGGFCIFNDVAIAVARLRARQFREPVLIVDLDLHDGNGTRT